jgi:phosphonate transport system substrate-binding protein
VLRISDIPYQKPEKLNRLYPLVASELTRQLGVKVAYVPADGGPEKPLTVV